MLNVEGLGESSFLIPFVVSRRTQDTRRIVELCFITKSEVAPKIVELGLKTQISYHSGHFIYKS